MLEFSDLRNEFIEKKFYNLALVKYKSLYLMDYLN